MRFFALAALVVSAMAAPATRAFDSVETSQTDDSLVSLMSLDGEMFQVPRRVADMSVTISNMIDDVGDADTIPLPNLSGKILSRIIEFSTMHANTDDTEELDKWDQYFMSSLGQSELFDVILGANYLNIRPLLDKTCKFVADLIKGKTPEEIRKAFNIKNDFTPEEEAEIRRENQWAFP
jgi:S-phase kinase-associated protein 1